MPDYIVVGKSGQNSSGRMWVRPSSVSANIVTAMQNVGASAPFVAVVTEEGVAPALPTAGSKLEVLEVRYEPYQRANGTDEDGNKVYEDKLSYGLQLVIK